MRWVALIFFALAPPAFADESVPEPFTVEKGELKLPSVIQFETGSDKLRPESDAPLRHVKRYLDANPTITLLRIEVHGDLRGAEAYTQALSEKRAIAVARFLVGAGVDCRRLIAVGFGSSRPIADNNTEEGRQKNRRTVFSIAALRGRPLGGAPVDGGGRIAGDCCR